MTPDQRQARRERQRLHNTEPRRKEALKLSDKKIKETRLHTLHPKSIAMEKLLYILEVVWPTMSASGAHASMTNSSDWVIPEFSVTPLHIPLPDEEVREDGSDDICRRTDQFIRVQVQWQPASGHTVILELI